MKKINIYILTIMFLLPLNNLLAFELFDGQRQGFTLGLGLGYGQVKITRPRPVNDTFETPMISGTLSYAFNDRFQLGVGKKALLGYKYNNNTVYHELGGVVLDFFFNKYYISVGSGIGTATNKISLDNILNGDGSFFGFGINLSEGLNIEIVTGTGTFDTKNSTVVTPNKITFGGILFTTHIY